MALVPLRSGADRQKIRGTGRDPHDKPRRLETPGVSTQRSELPGRAARKSGGARASDVIAGQKTAVAFSPHM
jgi:hypothetical protein